MQTIVSWFQMRGKFSQGQNILHLKDTYGFSITRLPFCVIGNLIK